MKNYDYYDYYDDYEEPKTIREYFRRMVSDWFPEFVIIVWITILTIISSIIYKVF